MNVARKAQKALMVFMAVALSLFVATQLSAPDVAEAASAKAVKSVALKVGGKTVTKKTYALEVGDGATIKPTVKPAKAKKKVAYKSSNPKVVSVNAKGKVTAKKAGTAKVTVKVTGKNGKAKSTWVKFSVSAWNPYPYTTTPSTPSTPSDPSAPSTPTPVTVSVVATGNTVAIGHDNVTVTATTSDGSPVTWSSNDESVAKVNALPGTPNSASVTGYSEGQAVITATSSTGQTASYTISVTAIPVEGIELDHTSVTISVGNGSSLKETITPPNATNRKVTWTSNDTNVVKVDNEGKLEAVGEGTATITVTTEDGNKTATAAVTVVKNTNDDANGIDISVTNPIDDDPHRKNVVLVGKPAIIQAKITKDGAPYEGYVDYRTRGVAGYSGLYEVSGFNYTTNHNGIVTFGVGLRNEYSGRSAILSMNDEDDWRKNAAYATIKITLTVGGSGLTKDIEVSFAQLLAATNYNNDAVVSVVNGRTSLPDDLTPVAWTGHPIATTYSETYGETNYLEEYVVEQQISDDKQERPVTLDAAPLLLLPSTTEAETNGNYEKDLSNADNHEVRPYDNYAGVERACVIEDVPGGMEYFDLKFSRLKLSDYSRLVVRAYIADTDYPIPGAQQYITPDVLIGSSSTENIVQISDVLKATGGYRKVDVKVFVESAGQVIDADDIGYTLTAASGRWLTQEEHPWDTVRLSNCVEWSVDSDEGYVTGTYLDPVTAEDYLGRNFNQNYYYFVSVPRFPRTGDAIIRGYKSYARADSDLMEIYLYPTTSDKGTAENKLDLKEGRYAIPATRDQAQALVTGDPGKSKWSWKKDSNGCLVVDSQRSGYVQATAHVDAYGVVAYDAHTSVQFSNTGEQEIIRPLDYYALTGQTIKLRARATSSNGQVRNGVSVTWSGVQGATKSSNASDSNFLESDATVVTYTNIDGVTELDLSASTRLDLSAVQARNNAYNVELMVVTGTNTIRVETGAASLHWIMPAIYYKDDVDGTEYVMDDMGAQKPIPRTEYIANSRWKIGTKIVGLGDGPVSAEHGQLYVEAIDNVRVAFDPTNDQGAYMEVVSRPSDTAAIVTSSSKGTAHVTATFQGLANASRPCSISLSYVETDINRRTTVHTFEAISVGTGEPTDAGGVLVLPIRWLSDDITTITLDYNQYFDIGNKVNTIDVYAYVRDKSGNGVEGVRVNPKITDEQGREITGINLKSEETDAKGFATISFDKPSAKGTYTLTASVIGGIRANPARLYFTDENTTFKRQGDPEPNTDGTHITVKFTKDLSSNDVSQPWFKRLFKVYNGSDELDVKSVTLGASVDEVIIETTTPFTSTKTVSVEISDRVTDDSGVTRYLLSNTGVLYTE